MKTRIMMFSVLFCFCVFKAALAQECIDIAEPIIITEDITICSGVYNVDVGPDPTPDQDPRHTPVITIEADNITITCEEDAVINGVDGEGFGIYNDGHSNVTVTGCEIKGYYHGIHFGNIPEGANLNHNYLHDNQNAGIELSGIIGTPPVSTGFIVEYNRAVDNTLMGEGYNIHVSWAKDGIVSHNTMSSETALATNNRVGIHYDASEGGLVQYNTGGVMGIAIGVTSDRTTVSYNVVMGSSLADLAAFVGCGTMDDVVFEYNIVHDGISGANWADDNYGIIFRNNIFYNLSGMAINMTCTMGDCPVPHLFANNIIYNCNVALNIGLHAMARNNLIVGNHIGIRSDGSAEGGASSYNDVWGNVLNYQGITPGTGAISDNPVFVNPADPAGSDGIFWTADDGFLLQANSPAIDAGDPADDYSKELNYPAGRIDLGAYGNTPLATKGYCVYPSSGMVVDKNMVFCSGKYEYDLSPLGVFLEVEAGDLEISCEEDTVIAGAGRRWQGIGVYANGYSNTSIIGCNFQNFNFGLFFWQPGHVFLNNVKVQENKRGVLVVQGDLEVQTSEISDNRWLDIGVYGGDLIIDDQTASHEPMIRPIKRDN